MTRFQPFQVPLAEEKVRAEYLFWIYSLPNHIQPAILH